MNATTQSATKITSLTLADFIAAGGEVDKLETITGEREDDTVHVFECADRDGTFTSDNACISWIDARFEVVVAALRSGNTSDLPESRGCSEI